MFLLKPWKDLFARMGLGRSKEQPRYFDLELDERLQLELIDVAEREKRTPSELEAELVDEGLARRRTRKELVRKWDSLSPRQQQVVALACLGYTNAESALKLGISESTVKTHLNNARGKFEMGGGRKLEQALSEWDFSEWDIPNLYEEKKR